MRRMAPARTGTVFEVRVGERSFRVDVEPLGGDGFRVHVDGRILEVDAREVERGVYSVLSGGRAHEVDISPAGEDAVRVEVRGHRFDVQVLDERRRRMRLARGSGHAGDEGEVMAPMPGKVVKLLVQPGESVRSGQGVVVVEAMKMENELRAPRDGVVREVRVAVGQPVELRETLVVIG